ncbi:hypothetical protein AJ80_04120 [Polytolypa hystricis UAMH7299]|uniref:amidase n=1 Tax=Polytolypa hystricis (strain UAMH7299) TaxID=1447883 RepID=A0A2B7YDA8_POLH7|nr:hypothetical protein AJ80_04120 [Polytolypa hystricis UAMH7299]
MATSWEIAAKTKREAVLDLIPKEWRIQPPLPPAGELRDVTGSYIQQFLSPREIEITETDTIGIVQRTTTGEWTAVEVTKAFCHRAAIAHQLVNCLHEIFFEAALADAKRLDAYFVEHKRPTGPLHGLPISLKDQFHVKGVETTMGYVGWIGTFEGDKTDPRRFELESELVRELRALGAVLHCKTSVPATLMSGETINNIIEYTWNPKNRHLSCGGSSGGEGALIALRGSAGGFGTDIGGSVRIPAAFNGLYGIRPSAGRIPYLGAANSMDGQISLRSVIGPLASSASGVKLLLKSVLSQHPWLYDPLCVEIPWRSEIEEHTLDLIQKSSSSQGQLAFGIMYDDGFVKPHPPITRALQVVATLLQKLGHKVIEWKPPSHATAAELASTIYGLDGGADASKQFGLSGETMMPQVIIPNPPVPPKNAMEIAAINIAKREYLKLYMDYWNDTAASTGTGRPIDGVIAPVAPHAAVQPMKYFYVGYSAFVNTLDYSSVTIPVTEADKAVDVVDGNYTPINDTDRAVYESYDPEIYHGAPVGLQLMGRRFQEEKMLTLAGYIGDELRRASGSWSPISSQL